jgi:acyl CoA:acetate/3-ketoacid CoA transferase alpha subunit
MTILSSNHQPLYTKLFGAQRKNQNKQMTKSIQTAIYFLCLFHGMLYAQNTAKINGRLQYPVSNSETVIVSLLLAKDLSLVKTQIADADGSFEFDRLQPERYQISTEADSYEPF